MSKAIRKQIELSSSSVKKLEDLRENTELVTAADVIRMGITVLDMVRQKKEEGYIMQFKKGDKIVEVILPIF